MASQMDELEERLQEERGCDVEAACAGIDSVYIQSTVFATSEDSMDENIVQDSGEGEGDASLDGKRHDVKNYV